MANMNYGLPHFYKVAQVKNVINPNGSATLMIRRYLETPHLHRVRNSLQFRKQHKSTFSELYASHLKYFCIPATSMPPERVFSKTGLLKNDCRNKISPKNLDYIVFLNSNVNIL